MKLNRFGVFLFIFRFHHRFIINKYDYKVTQEKEEKKEKPMHTGAQRLTGYLAIKLASQCTVLFIFIFIYLHLTFMQVHVIAIILLIVD